MEDRESRVPAAGASGSREEDYGRFEDTAHDRSNDGRTDRTETLSGANSPGHRDSVFTVDKSGHGTASVLPESPEPRRTLNETEIRDVMNRLAEAYPDAGCALHFRTPFQLLVAVVLSAQTTDKKVNQVTPALFDRCPTAFEMASLTEVELQEAIRTIGLYRNKAKNLIGLSRMLVEKYDGAIPEDQKLLEELPGVGRKSANVVMAEAFGHQRIAVDTHVFRVSNRIGLICAKNVLDTEKALMRVLPESRWTEMHHTIIFHGRQVCHARKPACGECVLSGLCLQRI